MIIERLLGDIPLAKFLDQYFLKLPFALANGCCFLRERFTWSMAASVLIDPRADLIISRAGARADVPRPYSEQEARELMSAGCTLGVRHAQLYHAELHDLAAQFHADFHAPVDVHLYVTPSGCRGFRWHYDAEDVFILQTAGSKTWELRKNTVNPWPLIETLPADMQYEREIMPLLSCTLIAGDWLYIPAGYWHRTQGNEESISLSVGVQSPAAIDVFDSLRRELVESLLWRQRLPPRLGSEFENPSSEQLVQWKTLLSHLAADVSARLQREEFLTAFLRAPPKS